MRSSHSNRLSEIVMSKKLTILIAPVEGVGHVNACIGLAEVLLSRGHKIIFVTSKEWKGKLAKYGFHEEFYEVPQTKKDFRQIEEVIKSLSESGMFSSMSSLEKMKVTIKSTFFDELVEKTIAIEPQLKQIVDRHKPDLFIVDNFFGSPTLIYSDRPWVFVGSGNPLFYIPDERTPPPCSGLVI